MADTRPKLLIVEDDPGLQRQLRWAYEGYQLFIAGDREEALEILRAQTPDVVTLDLGLPPDPDGTSEGMAALADILAERPGTKVIVASGHSERASAQRAIAQGAWDFYQKPLDIGSLGHIVGRAFHVHALEEENRRLAQAAPADHRALGRFITAAPEMLSVTRMVERAANTDAAVLLVGAVGTGKALLARGLHDCSARAKAPFVTINCAASPDATLESAPFERAKMLGAQGGTLFLDEVGHSPEALQGMLLSILDEQCGGRDANSPHMRIICSTHLNLEELIEAGRFREDLYYRLAEVTVHVPPLAARAGDAVLLARHFVTRYAADLNPQVQGLSADAIAAIDCWTWPGNVRELKNRVKRAVILAQGKLVSAANLDLRADDRDEQHVITLRAAREAADQQAIRRALARADGNVSAAARLLGVSRPKLYDLMKSYNLQA